MTARTHGPKLFSVSNLLENQLVDGILIVGAVIAALAIFDMLAVAFGVDSRDGFGG
jgi:hypothetical protein